MRGGLVAAPSHRRECDESTVLGRYDNRAGQQVAPAQPFACSTCHTLHAYIRSAIVRPAAVLLAAAALLALTACSTEQADVNKAEPSSSAPADTGKSSTAEKAAGIPDAPTGADRAAYLAAIKAVDPRIAEDEEKAIDAGRNQCSSLMRRGRQGGLARGAALRERRPAAHGRPGQAAEYRAAGDAVS